MNRPVIDIDEIAKAMRDARAIAHNSRSTAASPLPHRLQSPAHGWLQPSPEELRWTLAIIVAVVFACFAVLP